MIEFPKVFPVACHTDNVGNGSIFVAIKGQRQDGVGYIITAIDNGAHTIIIDQDTVLPAETVQYARQHNVSFVPVANTRKSLAQLSAQALQFPAKKLKIIAVTGTKGKTTSVFLLEHVMRSAGYKTALLSTIKNKILQTEYPTHLTTQLPDYLHMFFNLCVQAGIEYVIMEVAAQAHTLYRTEGIEFEAVLFTNFSQEHGEFYPDLEQYFAAKLGIVQQCKPTGNIIINIDDQWCRKIVQNPQACSFSLRDPYADFYIHVESSNPLVLHVKGHTIETQLLGRFNGYNLAGILALCDLLGIDMHVCKKALRSLEAIPGRIERHMLSNGACCIIDYAHNPSSYESVLSTLRTMTDHLIVVFGCGGQRDSLKRPLMGALAAQYGDHVFVTSDNPRFEDPEKIVHDILAGIDQEMLHKISVEYDRQKAIEKACALSKKSSIIALLGKGPDHYQLIQGTRYYFNEAEIIKRVAF